MTPHDHLESSRSTTLEVGSAAGTRIASGICLLAGVWLFVSPWVYGAAASGNAWNNWIVGGLMVLIGIVRLARPAYSSAISWFNTILGIWTFFSPWIYGYSGDTGRLINSLCVGFIVFVFSIAAATSSRKKTVITPFV
jgi:hypothetical protein